MEETIDLRPYLSTLGRYLWLIGGAIVLAIAISVGIYMWSDEYQAIALVTVPEPSQELQFDPRIVSTTRTGQLLDVYPELAKSSDLLERLLIKAGEITEGRITTLAQLRAALQVTTSAGGRLLRLVATDTDADAAAALANAWAKELVATADALYGRGGIDYYNYQLADANRALQIADDALVAFQTTNRQGIVDNELVALTELQKAYLADQSKFKQVLADIDALRLQLESNSVDSVTLSEQLAALTVQLRAYEATPIGTQTAPQFQLNINSDAQLTTANRAEQLQRLDALRVSVEAALGDRQAQLDELAPPIFALQTEKQQLFNQGERLLRAREVAEETYVTVARKIDEERVASRETLVRVASQAATPENPTRPNIIALVSLLSIAFVIPLIAIIIFLTWWRSPRRQAA